MNIRPRHLSVLLLVSLLPSETKAQGIYDQLKDVVVNQAVPIILYESPSAGTITPLGYGSATLYGCPTESPTNTMNWVCLITAKHVLSNKVTGVLGSGLLAKINMPTNSPPRYIKVPLQHNAPRNYWVSPSGLDLCVIPLPPEIGAGADVTYFSEPQIVTPETWEKENIQRGSVVQALCYQWEYLEEVDFRASHTSPTARFAHLSRGGFIRMPGGALHVRPHVIDMHSSPGNSGAIAILYVPKEGLRSNLMFLGVVQGFIEEMGGYETYKAPVREANRIPLQLVNQETGATNRVAITIKTVANPNLTLITPVHELATLRNSPEFTGALMWMAAHRRAYEVLNGLPSSGGTPAAQGPASAWIHWPKVVSLSVLVVLAITTVLIVNWRRSRQKRTHST